MEAPDPRRDGSGAELLALITPADCLYERLLMNTIASAHGQSDARAVV